MKKLVIVLWVMAWQNSNSQNLVWAKHFGGTLGDAGTSIAVDPSGNVYTLGFFRSTADFDPSPGVLNLTSSNNTEIFISSLDANGNLNWVDQVGDTFDNSFDYFTGALTVDLSGNIYVTGYFLGTADLDPGPDTLAFTSTFNGYDAFIIKLDVSGNLIWAKLLISTSDVFIKSVTVDNSENVYACGNFNGTADFNPGQGTFNLITAGGTDVFIVKLNASGNFVWAKQMGGTSDDVVRHITVDDVGSVYTIGDFRDTADFNPGSGTFNLTSFGSTDIFIAKLNTSGSFIWAKQMGGYSVDHGYSMKVDVSGNVFATGNFSSTADFDPGPDTLTLNSQGLNIFITKLDASGNLTWVKQVGGNNSESIAIDALGNVYVTGFFDGTSDFDPGPSIFNLTSLGSQDIFILQLGASGDLNWAKQIGSPLYDNAPSLTVDDSNYVYVTGWFHGTVDFDPGPSQFNLTSAGEGDVFVIKLSSSVSISGTILTETGIPVHGVTVTLSGDDSLTVMTDTSGAYSFNVEPNGTYTITPSKSNDSIPNNGITSIDALLMRRHILGLGALPSPYKIITAAEVNADGDTIISTQDILFTRSLILGNITSFPTNRLWQFVSSDYVFPDTQHPFPFDKTRTYINITTNQTNQNFIGIKLGDVNNSWDANIP